MADKRPQMPYMEEIRRKWAELPAPDLERFFLGRLEDIAAASGASDPEYAAYANELGTLYRVTARFSEGEAAFKQALASIEMQEGRSDRYATCLDNLAELYRLDGRLDECEQALAQADALFSDKGSDEYAACLNYQGHAHMERGEYDTAAACYERALSITQDRRAGTIDAATAYQNVANAHFRAGRLQRAADYLQRALEVYDAYGLPVNAHYVGLLNTLAAVASQQGEALAASEWLMRAVSALDACKMSPLDSVVVLANAAMAANRAGHSDDARYAAERARSLAAQNQLEGNAQVARVLQAVESLV